MQHEQAKGVHVVPTFVMDTLGSPFKVTLLDSVTVSVDPKTGKKVVTVPDVVGLIGAVVRARVCHQRKLNGAEIKFIRNALSLKAKAVAEFLDMSPEHLSRCEAGEKTMSAGSEKTFRCAAFLATVLEEPSQLFIRPDLQNLKPKNTELQTWAVEFANAFVSMKIDPIHAVNAAELEFKFVRETPGIQGYQHQNANNDNDHDKDDEKWVALPTKAA